jgi:ribonuclease Z
MRKLLPSGVILAATTVLAIAVGLVIGNISGIEQQTFAQEAGRKDVPVQKGVYFPNTETLAPNEMRVISCGTGLPTPLTKAQKSACFMVELGNGDIFLFDIGTGSVENLFAIQPRFAKVDKVFISHLHTDHFGDLDALWVGGWGSGRYTPLHVYGPSGAKPELGTAAAVEALTKAYAWDIAGRSGAWPDAGGRMIAHEFDYKQDNEIVYEKNGVRITSFPAIHVLDGSVSYRLDWNGLSFVFGGDSVPNKWFVEYAKGADIVVHECIYTPEGMNQFYGWNNMRTATYVAAYIHTPPSAFGKLMSAVRPRMAVAYHALLLPELLRQSTEAIRSTYDGPLTIAGDLVVWNVTKEEITVREAVVSEMPYPPPAGPEWGRAERSEPKEKKISDAIQGGWWDQYKPPPLPEGPGSTAGE